MEEVKFQEIYVASIHESKHNPRKHFDAQSHADLTESVKLHGVLVPILVRPLSGKKGEYELVAGARRLRAAKEAKLDMLPARVVELTDEEALELALIENLQRNDLDPLAEAEGYRRLTKMGYDVARIAGRIGKSTSYVYDRMKLADLVPEAKQLLDEERITTGHAVLLARLTPEWQKKAIGDPDSTALFSEDHGLFDPREDDVVHDVSTAMDTWEGKKARSVRELEAWIAENVRFKIEQPVNVDLFPLTAAAIAVAREEKLKIVEITYDYMLNDNTREKDGPRVYGERAWKPVDGPDPKAKACDFAVLGVVVTGPGRGEAFRVCIAKEKCAVHWGAEQKAKARNAQKGDAAGASKSPNDLEIRAERNRREQQKAAIDQARWKKALPAIAAATAERIAKMPVKPGSFLADLVIRQLTPHSVAGSLLKQSGLKGKTPEDVLRRAAFLVAAMYFNDWRGPSQFASLARKLGVDVAKIMKATAPAAVPTCKKCGCTEEKACAGGCSWAKPGLCSKCAEKKPAKKAARKRAAA